LGVALRSGEAIQFVTLTDELEHRGESDEEDRILDRLDFRRLLRLCAEQGVIDAFGAWVMEQLYDGLPLAELAAETRVQRQLDERGVDIDAYAAALHESLFAFGRRQAQREA